MDLKKYNNKSVRITDKFGDIYEGICYYNSSEYNYHELGVNQDSLVILQFTFYKSIIKKVEEIEITNKYGYIEKLIIEDDIDFIEDVLYSEEEENIYRLLLCIEDNQDKIKDIDELKVFLKKLINFYKNDKINEEIKKILNRSNNGK